MNIRALTERWPGSGLEMGRHLQASATLDYSCENRSSAVSTRVGSAWDPDEASDKYQTLRQSRQEAGAAPLRCRFDAWKPLTFSIVRGFVGAVETGAADGCSPATRAVGTCLNRRRRVR